MLFAVQGFNLAIIKTTKIGSFPLPGIEKLSPSNLNSHTERNPSTGRRSRYQLRWWTRRGGESGRGRRMNVGGSGAGRLFFISLLADESGVKNLLWREPLITPIYSKLPIEVFPPLGRSSIVSPRYVLADTS